MKPKLRFKEFTDDWEEKKLGEIAESFDYGIGASAIEYDGKHKYIRITDIDDKTHKFIENDLKSPNESDETILEQYKVNENDILFARTGATTGKTYLYNSKDKDLYFAGFLIRAHIIKEIANSYFVYSQTLLSNYDKWVKIMSMRTGQPGINAQQYKKLSIQLPSLPEQEKIGTFLSLVDQRIEKAEKKVSLLKEEKKGWMQKLFQQEIRFKDEQGNDYPDWKEKKIKDILNYEQPNKYIVQTTEYNNTFTIPVLTANKSFILGYTEENYNVYSKECIIFDDFTLESKYVNFPFKIKSSAIKILTSKHQDNIYFISQLLQNTHFISEGHARHYIGIVQNTKIQIPSLPEQEKIANFLSLLDQRIEKEERKVELLKEEKKGLLQNMFM